MRLVDQLDVVFVRKRFVIAVTRLMIILDTPILDGTFDLQDPVCDRALWGEVQLLSELGEGNAIITLIDVFIIPMDLDIRCSRPD